MLMDLINCYRYRTDRLLSELVSITNSVLAADQSRQHELTRSLFPASLLVCKKKQCFLRVAFRTRLMKLQLPQQDNI